MNYKYQSFDEGPIQFYKNSYILDDIKDMINDLEDDTNIEARLWVSSKTKDIIDLIDIELNHGNLNPFTDKELDKFIKRLKSYMKGNGRVRIISSDKEYITLSIRIFE